MITTRVRRQLLLPWALSAASCLVLLGAPPALAGGSSSHGIDDGHGDDPFAWFMGKDEVIRYCWQVSPEFPVSRAKAGQIVAGALATWREYLTRKLPAPSTPDQAFATRATAVACDGRQDLTFYFGVTNESVEEHLAHYKNPAGFACRNEAAVLGGWNPGYVWITGPKTVDVDRGDGTMEPVEIDWTVPGALDTVVLHELGHVFGVGHVEGTVMARDLLRVVFVQGLPASGPSVLAIDDARELVPCDGCKARGDAAVWPGKVDAQAYATLTGQPAVGAVSARLLLKPANGDLTWELELQAGSGPKLHLPLVPEHPAFRPELAASEDTLFNRPPLPMFAPWRGVAPTRAAWPAIVTKPGGGTVTVYLERNAHDGTPYAVTGIENGRTAVLYLAYSSVVRP